MSESRAEIDTEALLRKPIWTVEDLAAFLSLPVATIQAALDGSAVRGVPHRASILGFKRDDVLRWLETRRDEA